MGRTCSTYGVEKRWGNLRERDHLEDPSADGRIILKQIFEKCDGPLTAFIWLRIGTGDELL